MGERRILVIGSQCDTQQRLPFLPELADQFYRAMLNESQGQCVPALPEGGLLIDPAVQQAKEAIRKAYRLAAENQATLFLAYVGHGERSGDDFFLLPKDAAGPRNSDSAVYLVQLIREEFQSFGEVDGLVVLLDACFAGVTLPDVAGRWVQASTGLPLRFELLTATGDNPAYDGCFTRILTQLLMEGDKEAGNKYLRAQDCTTPLHKECKRQQPQQLVSSYGPDRGLWLMRNKAFAAAMEPWLRSEISDEIARLTSHYQPPALLAQVPALSEANRCVAVIGQAGAGKSALVAALTRPEVTRGAITPGFLSAVVFVASATPSEELAGFLAWQLSRSVPGFADCLRDFEARTQRAPEWAGLDALHRKVIGPLRMLNRTDTLHIALDGLDQAPDASLPVIVEFLQTLATDGTLAFVRAVVTAKPDTTLPAAATVMALEGAPGEDLRAYFTERNMPEGKIEAAVVRADGNWLVAEMLADLAQRDADHFDPTAIAPGVMGICNAALLQAGAGDRRRWREELRPVLSVLAVAGAGPVLPFPLFRRACRELGGPQTNSRLRDVLVNMRGFVTRTSPGSEEEQVGVFHAMLAEHLLRPGQPTSVDAEEAHLALLVAIGELAPAGEWDARNPDACQRYAFRRHAEHLWAIGWREEAVDCLHARTSNIPKENLDLWGAWLNRIEAELGHDHPATLAIRSQIAHWTGMAGAPREALQLFQKLLSDSQRIIGPDDPATLMVRHNIAFWLGETGGTEAEVLGLFRDLLDDRRRILGPNHRDTLQTLNNVASWTGRTGDAEGALSLFRELLPLIREAFGAEHHGTFTVRGNIAHYLGQLGQRKEALQQLRGLLADQQSALGPNHPDTFKTHANIAVGTGALGNREEALQELRKVLADRERVLGADHPDTLLTRANIASFTGETGQVEEALRLFSALLPDQQRVLGHDHPDTLSTRGWIAAWTLTASGKEVDALQLFQALLSDFERCYGPAHAKTNELRVICSKLREKLGG
jgi:tetratricopeptide (TPR) repeat protein